MDFAMNLVFTLGSHDIVQHRVSRWRVRGLVAAALAAMLLAGCAINPATPVSVADAALRGSDPNWSITTRIDPEIVRINDVIRVRVSSPRSGYLYLFHVGTDGKTLSLVFPNTVDAANATTQGVIELPNPNWQLRATGPAGTGYLLATVTAGLQDINAINSSIASGRMPTLNGAYGAGLVTYQEVAR